MRVKITCFIIVTLVSVAAFSQEKVKFHSINMAGIATGNSGNYGIIQTVNGLKYKKWFAGTGLGLDYYKNKTIPLFVDLRTTIARTNLFIFGDFGYNFPWHNKPGKEITYYDTYNFSGGAYSEVGVGYKMKLNRLHYLLFSSGYSYKKLNNKIGEVYPCLVGPCPVNYSKYEYGYGRILFKAGIAF